MEVSEAKLREYGRKIMLSRMRLLCNSGFYGLLLMHLKMRIGSEHETAWTDGKDTVFFHPDFLEGVSDGELDYALSHVLLHLVLDHTGRKGDYEGEEFDLAADIIVNSNILRANGGGEESIYLREYGGVQPHLAPDGQEGWRYSLEELCEMLRVRRGGAGEEIRCKEKGTGASAENEKQENGKGASAEDKEQESGKGASAETEEKGKARGASVGQGDGGGKGAKSPESCGNGRQNGSGNAGQKSRGGSYGWDYHRAFPEKEGDEDLEALEGLKWQGRILQAAEVVRLRAGRKDRGLIPAFVERYVEELKKPHTDWRTVLDEFVQEEIHDYSFCPPDRRFADTPFFLPDYNEKDEHVEKILFMIDTSGSMSDEEITQCYSEIKGAVDQFGGKLEGWLGFFDATVTEPQPFTDEEEFVAIRPKGGGGTRFDIIFDYVRDEMEEPPVSIVILTDGFAPFPDSRLAMEIPVLWIINNEDVTPPWGKVARIPSENNGE